MISYTSMPLKDKSTDPQFVVASVLTSGVIYYCTLGKESPPISEHSKRTVLPRAVFLFSHHLPACTPISKVLLLPLYGTA